VAWDPLYLATSSSFLLYSPKFLVPFFQLLPSALFTASTPPPLASSTARGRRRPHRRATPPASHPCWTTPPFLNPPFPCPRHHHHSPRQRRPCLPAHHPTPTTSANAIDYLAAVLSACFAIHCLPPPPTLLDRHPPPPRRATPPPPAVPHTHQPHRRYGCHPGHPSRSSAH
jgi:hypothetical protein